MDCEQTTQPDAYRHASRVWRKLSPFLSLSVAGLPLCGVAPQQHPVSVVLSRPVSPRALAAACLTVLLFSPRRLPLVTLVRPAAPVVCRWCAPTMLTSQNTQGPTLFPGTTRLPRSVLLYPPVRDARVTDGQTVSSPAPSPRPPLSLPLACPQAPAPWGTSATRQSSSRWRVRS